MTFVRANKRIDVWREASKADFDGTVTLLKQHSGIPARVRFRRTQFLDLEGLQVAADGGMFVESRFDLQERDVFSVSGQTKRYRVETLDEIVDASGDVVQHKIRFTRDQTSEA